MSNSSSLSSLSFGHVKVTYRIPSSTALVEPTNTPQEEDFVIHSKIFAESTPARMGLNRGIEPKKPLPGDYAYSGMHDTGPLVPPREAEQQQCDDSSTSSSMTTASLIASVQAAKQYNDQYMTTVIQQTIDASSPVTKKSKQTTLPEEDDDDEILDNEES